MMTEDVKPRLHKENKKEKKEKVKKEKRDRDEDRHRKREKSHHSKSKRRDRDKENDKSVSKRSSSFEDVKPEVTSVVNPSSVATPCSAGLVPSFKIPRLKRETVEAIPSIAIESPASAESTVHPLPLKPMKPTSPGICKFWLAGNCSKGECFFDHAGSVVKVFKKCKYYAFKDNCTKANACSFMHETFPCRAYHLLGGSNCPTPCKFSHKPLDEVTQPLFEEDVRDWKADVEPDEEDGGEDWSLYSQIAAAMEKCGLKAESTPTATQTSGEKFNFAGFRGPNGKESLKRYAIYGTVGLLFYARGNQDKFEAYERAYSALREFHENEYRKRRLEIEEQFGPEEEEEDGYWEWDYYDDDDDDYKVQREYFPFFPDDRAVIKDEGHDDGEASTVKYESQREKPSTSSSRSRRSDEARCVKVEVGPLSDLANAGGDVKVVDLKR